LLQGGRDSLDEGPWLFLACLLCSDNPAAAASFPLIPLASAKLLGHEKPGPDPC